MLKTHKKKRKNGVPPAGGDIQSADGRHCGGVQPDVTGDHQPIRRPRRRQGE